MSPLIFTAFLTWGLPLVLPLSKHYFQSGQNVSVTLSDSFWTRNWIMAEISGSYADTNFCNTHKLLIYWFQRDLILEWNIYQFILLLQYWQYWGKHIERILINPIFMGFCYCWQYFVDLNFYNNHAHTNLD